LAETETNPLRRPLPDGIVPEEEVTRTEDRWIAIVLGMLGVMMAVIVVTGVTNALHPPSNVEVIDPITLHLGGEFAESNLGSAVEPDGCHRSPPADTPVKFRLTSADAIHGLLIVGTNVNTMVVPGFVAEVRTRFNALGDYRMPCDEFCGVGHQGMWAHVNVVPKGRFPHLSTTERTSCVQQ